MSIIQQYISCTSSADANLLIDFAELLMVLLRDDCVFVRNEASDIVLSMMHTNRPGSDVVQKGLLDKSAVRIIGSKTKSLLVVVIPLVAEDHLLNWLSVVFTELDGPNSWQHWLELIKLIQTTASNSDDCEVVNGDDDLNENDVNAVDNIGIFEANEINMFGETVYISCKCYQHLMRSIDASGKEPKEIAMLKDQIYLELPMMRDFELELVFNGK